MMRVYEPPPKNYESLSKDKKDAYHAEAAREWHAQKKMNGLDDAAGPLPKSAAGDICRGTCRMTRGRVRRCWGGPKFPRPTTKSLQACV